MKRTVKVVEPDFATGEEGWAVTVNWEACVPPIATFGVPVRLSAAVPRFSIVKVASVLAPYHVSANEKLPPSGTPLSSGSFSSISGTP